MRSNLQYLILVVALTMAFPFPVCSDEAAASPDASSAIVLDEDGAPAAFDPATFESATFESATHDSASNDPRVLVAPRITYGASIGGIVGLDNIHGIDSDSFMHTGPRMDDLRGAIQFHGFSITPLTDFTAEEFAGVSHLFLRNPYLSGQVYTTTQIDAIQAYIADGGTAVFVCDTGGSNELYLSNFNTLVAPYGVQFSTTSTYDMGIAISNLAGHELTQGISSIGMDYIHHMDSVTSPATTLTTSAPDVLAVAENIGVGGGNAIFLSDSTLFRDAAIGADYWFGSLGNAKLLENILNFGGTADVQDWSLY